MFHNREDAGRQLADKLQHRQFVRPLILAIPRGGVVTGAVVAHQLNIELDVALSRKMRSPDHPEMAIGAITEDGFIFLDPAHEHHLGQSEGYLAEERRLQLKEMARRQQMIRRVCVQAEIADRSVIVIDDGVVTGSTMIGALQALKPHKPRELIVAVPVIAADRMQTVHRWCDDLITILCPPQLMSISSFYSNFDQVSDDEVLRLLHECGCRPPARSGLSEEELDRQRRAAVQIS